MELAADQTPRPGRVAFWDGWTDEANPADWDGTGYAKWPLADGTWLVEVDEAGVGDDEIPFPVTELRWLA